MVVLPSVDRGALRAGAAVSFGAVVKTSSRADYAGITYHLKTTAVSLIARSLLINAYRYTRTYTHMRACVYVYTYVMASRLCWGLLSPRPFQKNPQPVCLFLPKKAAKGTTVSEQHSEELTPWPTDHEDCRTVGLRVMVGPDTHLEFLSSCK